MRRSIMFALAVGFVGALAASASADDRYHPMPPGPGQDGKFELRVVQYDDGVHGEMTVEVHNLGNVSSNFSARGLYFVPDDNPNTAPQRLAVVGGVRTGSEDAPRDVIQVAAGGTMKVRFDVYCIDEDRHSPESTTQFTMARTRLPADLSVAIEGTTAEVVKTIKLKADDDQQRRIQPLVWMARREPSVRGVKLRGDGAQERR
jgi:hypothetical protein